MNDAVLLTTDQLQKSNFNPNHFKSNYYCIKNHFENYAFYFEFNFTI